MSKMEKGYIGHVISHSHWDREWYHPFQVFRFRLVSMIDELLERMEAKPDYRYFHFDGQTILLEDYEEVRPENAERLKRLIRQGRILIGPWYTSSDEFIPCGESLVRNLLLGDSQARELGVECLKVGYVIDQFGHIGQLPQILAGFGIKSAILFRGTNEESIPAEALWEGVDGTRILLLRTPDATAYSNFLYEVRRPLFTEGWNESRVLADVRRLIEKCAKRSSTRHLLLMDGVDHIEPEPKLIEIFRLVNESLDEVELVHSRLDEYVGQVEACTGELPVIRGELRQPAKEKSFNRLMADVLSSRIYLKQMNNECETLLLKWAEPLGVIAEMEGLPFEKSYLKVAWKWLLQNHAHDSICGCSIDAVHRDMEFRFAQAKHIAETLVKREMNHIAKTVNLDNLPRERKAMVLFNPTQRDVEGLREVTLDFPLGRSPQYIRIYDVEGKELPYQVVDIEHVTPRIGVRRRYDIPHDESSTQLRVILPVRVPAYGYTTLFYEGTDIPKRYVGSLISGSNCMGNSFVEVTLYSDGTFDLKDKRTERLYKRLHTFEDTGDVGDGWNYIAPRLNQLWTSQGLHGNMSVVCDGPHQTTFRVILDWRLPKGADLKESRRMEVFEPLRVVTDYTLRADSPALAITTRLVNTIRDHRLRVCFPTWLNTPDCYSDGAYDLIKRPISLPDTSEWSESETFIRPQQSFIALSDGKAGLAVVSRGLPESAVYDNQTQTIKLTLLRAFATTVNGPKDEEGQCLRPLTFEYYVLPLEGDVPHANLFREAELLLCPPQGVVCREASGGRRPLEHSYFKVEPETVQVTALTKLRYSDEVLLRLFNPLEESITVRVTSARGLSNARKVRLDETYLEDIEIIDGRSFLVGIGPKTILSLALTLSGE